VDADRKTLLKVLGNAGAGRLSWLPCFSFKLRQRSGVPLEVEGITPTGPRPVAGEMRS